MGKSFAVNERYFARFYEGKPDYLPAVKKDNSQSGQENCLLRLKALGTLGFLDIKDNCLLHQENCLLHEFLAL